MDEDYDIDLFQPDSVREDHLVKMEEVGGEMVLKMKRMEKYVNKLNIHKVLVKIYI